MRSTDPDYYAARDRFFKTGELRVDGDLSQIDGWLNALDDPIVDRMMTWVARCGRIPAGEVWRRKFSPTICVKKPVPCAV